MSLPTAGHPRLLKVIHCRRTGLRWLGLLFPISCFGLLCFAESVTPHRCSTIRRLRRLEVSHCHRTGPRCLGLRLPATCFGLRCFAESVTPRRYSAARRPYRLEVTHCHRTGLSWLDLRLPACFLQSFLPYSASPAHVAVQPLDTFSKSHTDVEQVCAGLACCLWRHASSLLP